MIGGAFLISGIVLAVSAALFHAGSLTAWSLTLHLDRAFFFASAGASAGYLTVSEVFPMEIRAMAIAFFYAVATALGGITGPTLFGRLVDSLDQMTIGFYIAAGLMIIAAFTEFAIGVDAEGESLEDIATPLTAEGAPEGDEVRDAPERDASSATSGSRAAGVRRSRRRASGGWSGMPQASSAARDTDLDREVDGSSARSGMPTARSPAASWPSAPTRATGAPGASRPRWGRRSRAARCGACAGATRRSASPRARRARSARAASASGSRIANTM